MRAVRIRTDRGSRFEGDTVHRRPDGILGTIERHGQARHEFNPSHGPNAHAHVQTAHNTIEWAFFEASVFPLRADFFAKFSTYQP